MFSGSFDPSSLILLFLGKDNSWIPYIAILFIIFQKWDSIMRHYKSITLYGKVQYKITGTIYTKIDESITYGSLDTSIWALIRVIDNLVKADKTLLSKASNIKLPYNSIFDSNDVIVFPSSDIILKLNEDINCNIEMSYKARESTKSDNTTMIDSTTITFTLTTTKTFETIMKYMNTIIENHSKVTKLKHSNTKYIIKPIYSKKSDDPEKIELTFTDNINFSTSKSFDNLFFDGKEELIKRLDTFINRNKYKKLGLPETLGLLLHGDPGTGKTSCIKAIAKYLDMSLIIVPMNQIKTKKRLEELFFSHRISVPQERRIYVFEEIDCNGWENIVLRRSLIKEEKENIDDDSTLVNKIVDAIQPNKKTDNSKEKDNDKLTLGGVLEIIDGLIECPGRVIIMTTNHKDRLDPALLRPGRIDMDIEFKKLRHCHIAEIYKKWYGAEIDEFYAEDIPDYKYTQAEISQLLFKYENDSAGFIKEITH